jgi:hypothetical protein
MAPRLRASSPAFGAWAIIGLCAVAAAACAFPDLQYATADGDTLDGRTDDQAAHGTGGDATVADEGVPTIEAGSADTTADAQGGTESSALETGGDGTDAEPAEGGGGVANADSGGDALDSADARDDGPADGPSTEAGSDGSACDQDGDHDIAPGPLCGGNDCDDHDARAYWGEPDYLTFTPTTTTNGDWNCNGALEKQYTPNVNCGLLNLGQCNTTSGLTGDPACGTAGSFVQCQTSGLLCVVGSTSTKMQACK